MFVKPDSRTSFFRLLTPCHSVPLRATPCQFCFLIIKYLCLFQNSRSMDNTNKGIRKKAVLRLQKEVDAMRKCGKYESVWLSLKGLGWVAIEKSPMKRTADEILAARYMADVGFKVILKNEAGQAITADGFIFSFAFEQKTPYTKSSNGIYKALRHARSKSTSNLPIDVAVIYDKFGYYLKQDIEVGIKEYERNHRTRFRGIVFITKTGAVKVFRHNRL